MKTGSEARFASPCCKGSCPAYVHAYDHVHMDAVMIVDVDGVDMPLAPRNQRGARLL
jgi:hypothetical protein